MENQTASMTKSDPIIIEQPGMRMTVEHRHGVGGADEGLTFDITTESEGKRILRFDCFYKNPHYHIGASGEDAVHKMKDEGIADPVHWTLQQLMSIRLAIASYPACLTSAGKRVFLARISGSNRVR